MFWENGTSLSELLVPRTLSKAATAFVEALDLNSIAEKTRNGRAVIVKRRNAAGVRLAKLANVYFRKAGIPIRYLSEVKDWQRREIESFNLLNGKRFSARPSGSGTVMEDKLPGESLWEHTKRGTLTRKMLRAAAREFRRAHNFRSRYFDSAWSHGDATTTNSVYDAATDTVRLIDFEIAHDKALSAKARHADDLLVFLLDMVGQVSTQQWLPFAFSFLETYGQLDVLIALRKRLEFPAHLPGSGGKCGRTLPLRKKLSGG